jgi:hypothetical protein
MQPRCFALTFLYLAFMLRVQVKRESNVEGAFVRVNRDPQMVTPITG